MKSSRWIGATETARVLELVGPLSHVVLVGGQALNFWAERYRDKDPRLEAEAPFTSKDIDFLGDVSVVRVFAERLGGECAVPKAFEPTPSSGIVYYVDAQGDKQEIDFLRTVYGLREQELQKLAIPVDISGRGAGPIMPVMHPGHCLESRIKNLLELATKRNEHGRKQARTAIVCLREALREFLDAGNRRPVLTWNNRLFRWCKRSFGKRAFLEEQLDLFDAALVDDRLGSMFTAMNYPRMRWELYGRRERWRQTRSFPSRE